jgi:uncharacterized protein (TIGR03086 family)
MFDHRPAAAEMARLVNGVRDDQLEDPTPCPDYTLGDLLEHVHGLSLAFTMAARKEQLPPTDGPPRGTARRLPADWRTAITDRLDALVAAWQSPAAWQGRATVAGVDMTGEETALVALDELVLHGWDVARASGQDLRADPASVAATEQFVAAFAGPEMAQARQGLFGPVVRLPDDAPLLDRVVGLAGRDPGWSPATR